MLKLSLYYSNYCYFCQKVMVFLQQNKSPVTLLSTSDSSNHAELVQGGGKGQVPCLKIETADKKIEWLYESDDILAFLANQ